MSDTSWDLAAGLLQRFLAKPARLQHLMERLPIGLDDGKRRSCQWLLYGSVRHLSFLDNCLNSFLKKKPKLGLRSYLLLASFEILVRPEHRAKAVNHAVSCIRSRYSKAEAGLANAVLRKMGAKLDESLTNFPKTVPGLAIRYSHPEWMVKRWVGQFGVEETQELLAWNEQEPELFVRSLEEDAGAILRNAGFGETAWSGYYKLEGEWSSASKALKAKSCYVQNPGARSAIELAADSLDKGGRVLDLCAAPGGKGIVLDRVSSGEISEIVSVDLPGPRLERLRENIDDFAHDNVRIVGSDLFDLEVEKLGQFEAVLLDAPCSNSGVLQRKIDAKWRQREKDLEAVVGLQKRMIQMASSFVKPGGMLVYSTCSIENEENQGVVDAFLVENSEDFEMIKSVAHFPWKAQHDGAGAFSLRRKM
ncbi:methyltransferase domain-containing protein [Puniceicoccaceae bacterium K14]|nr:methyltransferase domain-containing protein [Puniceicoccaceae bacterium K14]